MLTVLSESASLYISVLREVILFNGQLLLLDYVVLSGCISMFAISLEKAVLHPKGLGYLTLYLYYYLYLFSH